MEQVQSSLFARKSMSKNIFGRCVISDTPAHMCIHTYTYAYIHNISIYQLHIKIQCGAAMTRPVFSKFLPIYTPRLAHGSDLCSASVTRVLYAISCWIGSRYSGTRMSFGCYQNTTHWHKLPFKVKQIPVLDPASLCQTMVLFFICFWDAIHPHILVVIATTVEMIVTLHILRSQLIVRLNAYRLLLTSTSCMKMCCHLFIMYFESWFFKLLNDCHFNLNQMGIIGHITRCILKSATVNITLNRFDIYILIHIYIHWVRYHPLRSRVAITRRLIQYKSCFIYDIVLQYSHFI